MSRITNDPVADFAQSRDWGLILALGPMPKSAMGHGAGFRWRHEPGRVLLVREKERPGVNLSALWQESRRCYRQ